MPSPFDITVRYSIDRVNVKSPANQTTPIAREKIDKNHQETLPN